jgi:hypothetical protein
VSDLTADNYARVAEAIGMRESATGYGMVYHDPATPWHRDPWSAAELPTYLAEPAQMYRIMEELKVSVQFDVEMCHWTAEALNATGEGCHWVHGVAQDKPGLAVLDCAARALRP